MKKLLVSYQTWKLAAPRLRLYYTTQATGYSVFACGDEVFVFATVVDPADITDFETTFKPGATSAASEDDAFLQGMLDIGVRLTNTQQVPTLEVSTWAAFKTTCLINKKLLIQYVEYTDAYEVYATDSLVWHIRLARPSADATDFDTNYKAGANARSNLSVVLVDAAGNVTTSVLGQSAPSSAAMVAFKDDAGNLEAPTVFDLDTGAGKQPTQGVSLRLSASGGSIEAKGQKAMAGSIPVVVSSDQSAFPVTVTPTPSSLTTVTSVTASISSVEILAANTSRLGASVHNDSNKVMWLKMGSAASSTSFTVAVPKDAYYEIPFGYTGLVHAAWGSGVSGSARVTEFV